MSMQNETSRVRNGAAPELVTAVSRESRKRPGRRVPARSLSTCAALLVAMALAPGAFAQGVVMPTKEVKYQVAGLVTAGTLEEQAKEAKRSIKGKVFRYRAFVLPDEDVAPLKKVLNAPAVAIVRVSALPAQGAKIVLEAVTNGGNNPNGILHISGQGSSRNEHTSRVKPLVEQTYHNLDLALTAGGVSPKEVMQVTCYLSTLTDLADVQSFTESRYPNSVNTYLQVPVPPTRGFVECEATARAAKAVGYVNPPGLTSSPNFTHVVSLTSPRMVWSGLHESQGCSPDAVSAMFQRLDATLKKHGSSVGETVFSYLYPNSDDAVKLTRDIRFNFYKRSHPPASSLFVFAGTADRSACSAVEVSAPVK